MSRRFAYVFTQSNAFYLPPPQRPQHLQKLRLSRLTDLCPRNHNLSGPRQFPELWHIAQSRSSSTDSPNDASAPLPQARSPASDSELDTGTISAAAPLADPLPHSAITP